MSEFINHTFGAVLVLTALALLIAEWIRLVQWRREPAEMVYSLRIFLRRATISFLMLAFVALVVWQPVVLARPHPARALGYLTLYLLVLGGILLFAILDFHHYRRLGRMLERRLRRMEYENLNEISRMLEQEMPSAMLPGGRPPAGSATRAEERHDVPRLPDGG